MLQLADVLCSGVCSALTALLEGPRATQLAVAQLVLSLAQLALARASLRAVPPRLAFYLAVRQLDISFGGAGTFRLIALMKRLESWDVLPLHPPPVRSLPRLTSDAAREPFLVMPVCRDHRGGAHKSRPLGDLFGESNSQGYTMSQRCRAALPAVANAAYALESLLPVVCAPLAAGLVSLVTWLVVLAPFGAVSSLLVRFAAACVAPAGAALPTRLLATLPTALAYAWGALGTVGALGLSCFLTIIHFIAMFFSLLEGVEQATTRAPCRATRPRREGVPY